MMVENKSLPFMFDSEPGLTHEQLIAKKQFIDLDRNRNGVRNIETSHFTTNVLPQILERRELKRWKKAMKSEPGLTLCGKRISQHCDRCPPPPHQSNLPSSNGDSSISQGEWTACLGVAPGAEGRGATRSPPRPVGKRRGPNPLKTWLKGD